MPRVAKSGPFMVCRHQILLDNKLRDTSNDTGVMLDAHVAKAVCLDQFRSRPSTMQPPSPFRLGEPVVLILDNERPCHGLITRGNHVDIASRRMEALEQHVGPSCRHRRSQSQRLGKHVRLGQRLD